MEPNDMVCWKGCKFHDVENSEDWGTMLPCDIGVFWTCRLTGEIHVVDPDLSHWIGEHGCASFQHG